VGALEQLRRQGVRPATVIDVGAAQGDWSMACHSVFPDASYILIEPLAEFAEALRRTTATFGAASTVEAAAGSRSARTTIHVHKDMFGSSLMSEGDDELDGAPREVQLVTVDELIAESRSPFLLKIDVQGSELDVLAGASNVLEQAQAVILEVSLFPFFRGGHVFSEVIASLDDRGFAVYDVIEPAYRLLDGALGQLDVVFVPASGLLRRDARYATPEQRIAQDASLRRSARISG
jgi:FkbM family methyltransferase